MNKQKPTCDELTQQGMTLDGALLVADSTKLDMGNMKIIALKVLAHEFRKVRSERDRLRRKS